MAAYFARRMVGGVATLFLTGLLMHTLLWYGPGGVVPYWEQLTQDAFWCHRCAPEDIELTVDLFNLDKPWPVSYVAWLFDPDEATEITGIYKNGAFLGTTRVPRAGIDFYLLGLHIRGSGALTGSFDYSTGAARHQRVEDVFGGGLGELMLLMVLALFISMGMVIMHRRSRPPVKELPYNLRQPVRRRAAYRTSVTNELFRAKLDFVQFYNSRYE